MKVENVVVVDHAQVPESPIKPRKTMNVAIAFVLGAMAAVGLIFLLEYLDTSIKTPEDVTTHLGLPVLGVIPLIEVDAAPQEPNRSDRRRRSSTKHAGVL
jgi:capsular polysaccharide biosynthesis protein